ncbi:hypothetical protein [Dongia deserti]|uniref:hypothetical protein n=1 Tax=Dongia deserti TaxID=2268030 RepID=UPI000E64C6EB|nr:hypothetical protein [Dongia deserti]
MANPLWPASLPQDVLVDGYEHNWGVGTIRSQTDTGPAKQRRRFTAVPRPFKALTEVDRTQLATLYAFWRDTLAMGSLPFDWVYPPTQATVTFRFISDEPPRDRPLPGAQLFEVSMNLEIMP